MVDMASVSDEDWRLSVRFASSGDAHRLLSSLRVHAAAALAADRLKEGVMAEHEGEWLRVYADSRAGLERAQLIINGVMKEKGVAAEEQAAHRLGPRSWEPVALPAAQAQDGALPRDHSGPADWGADAEATRAQVRFELPGRDSAESFARTLAQAGHEAHRRGSSVFLFADDDAAAHELGESLSAGAPEDARVFYMDEGPEHTIFI